jgi:Holliday junction resolvase
MGFRKTFTLFLILIIVGGYYYFFEAKHPGEKGNRESVQKAQEVKKVFTFSDKDVMDLRIFRGGERIHYQKNNKGWQMVEPQLIQGNASALDGFLESLKNVSEVDTVIEHPSDISEFGLDRPSLTIEVKTRGSVLPKTLFLGSEHPTHTSIYAKTSDSARVFLVGSLIRWEVDKEFDNLKNKSGPFFERVQ